MPQLNPTPWFFTLLLSWAIMLIIFKMKVLHTTPTNTPTTPDMSTHHTASWNWPWT